MDKERISKQEAGFAKYVEEGRASRIKRRKANIERRQLEAKQRGERKKINTKEKRNFNKLIQSALRFPKNSVIRLTVEQYQKLFEAQNGCCAICGRHQREFGIRLAVDHDHKTNKIRGLLCTGCNLDLGFYEKHNEQLKQFEKYLRCRS